MPIMNHKKGTHMFAKSLYHTYEFINPKNNETLAYVVKVNAKILFASPTKPEGFAFLGLIGAGYVLAKELIRK